MSLSKQYGPVSISESAGQVTISISESIAAGGGAVKGFVSGQVQASAVINGALLIDAGLALLSAKYPAFASEIALLQAEVDKEIASL